MILATLINSPQRAIAIVIAVVALLAWVLYAFVENQRQPEELREQFYDAPNRKAPPDDDAFEGPRLDRFLGWALVSMVVVAIGLPIYWLAEPGREEGSIRGFDKRSVKRGDELFLSTTAKPHAGFGCADCHGSKGQGGVAKWNLPVYADGKKVIDPATRKDQLVPVQWAAPAVNTVALRYRPEQIRNVLVYGRGANKPMPAWGVAGGGPMNDQQIDDLVNYLKFLAIEEYPSARKAYQNTWDANGHDAVKAYEVALLEAGKRFREESEASPTKLAGEYLKSEANAGQTEGQALFNLFCARCHTKGWSYQTSDTPYAKPETAGGGWYGPNLTGGSTVRQFPAVQDHIDYVANGVADGIAYGAGGVQKYSGGGMPYFGNTLTEAQLKAVIDYERGM